MDGDSAAVIISISFEARFASASAVLPPLPAFYGRKLLMAFSM
jgi:hypothetical protein